MVLSNSLWILSDSLWILSNFLWILQALQSRRRGKGALEASLHLISRVFLWEFPEDGGTQKHWWEEETMCWKQSWALGNPEPLNKISTHNKSIRGFEAAEACMAFPSSCLSSRHFFLFSFISCFFLSFQTCLSSCSEEEEDSAFSLFFDSTFQSILRTYLNALNPSFPVYFAFCSTHEPNIPSSHHPSIINIIKRLHTILAILDVSQPNSSRSAL